MMVLFNQRFFSLFHKFSINLLPVVFAVVLFCGCEASPDPWPVDGFGGGIAQSYSGTTNTGGSGGTQFINGSGGIIGGSGGIAGDSSVSVTVQCGDGVAAPSESCDGNDVKGVTCEQLNAGTGQPRCSADCRFDVSTCSKYINNSTGGSSGSSGTGGASGTISNPGTGGAGGVDTPPLVCTPNATETEACSECPETNRTRQCLADGTDWNTWSECDCGPALPPECDGQTQAPTWNNSVGGIMQSTCGGCHNQARSYSSFVSWRGGSTTWDSTWTASFGMHSLSTENRAIYNCWVALGLPEN